MTPTGAATIMFPGKEEAARLASTPPRGALEPPLLLGDRANLLIEGDNLPVLQHLRATLRGGVRVIYIDPPYNTGNGFHYNDRFAGTRWLAMMLPRLMLAHDLLSLDGALFVSIDDNQVHSLRMLLDEVFGAECFLTTIVWHKVFARKSSARGFSESHEYVLAYERSKGRFERNLLPRSEAQRGDYRNPDADPRGPWISVTLSARNPYSAGTWGTTTPSGRVIEGPPKGRYWAISKEKFDELGRDGRVTWGKRGDGVPRRKVFLSEVKQGMVPHTLWSHTEVGSTQDAKKELLARVPFDSSASVFDTPKPLRLIERVLRIATRPDRGDVVLDFFAGTGTTGEAVLRLNAEDGGDRRFVLVELGAMTGHADFPTIAHIARARLDAAIAAAGASSRELRWVRLVEP